MNKMDELLERLDANAANWYLDDGGASEEAAATIRALREALVPFARVADMHNRDPSGTTVGVNVDRCRDARAALEASHGRVG